jgi:DNA repair photolyase
VAPRFVLDLFVSGAHADGMPKRPLPARGATTNALSTRFDTPARDVDGDWLDSEGEPAPARTEVSFETPRSAITRNRSPDVFFDRSINAYRGCEHGCVYCFARPTHAYLGLSPGLDFERRLTVKRNIPDLLRRELTRPGYQCRPIALGTNTDPYQPVEARYRTTRQILELLDAMNHPVLITTKSARVLDDLALLARLAGRRLASVMISVTSLTPATARTMEPRASAPHRRIAAIRALADAGVPVAVAASPIIPAINDHEIEAILAAAAAAGATMASMIVVRLPHEVAPIFRAWLEAHVPERATKVMHLVNDMRQGKDNEGEFFERFRPKGAYAAALRLRFDLACKRLGLSRRQDTLRTDLFSPPQRQLSLL